MFGIPSCKEVFDKRHQVESFSTLQLIKYKIHMSICKNCQHFNKTMDLIEEKMKQSIDKKGDSIDPKVIESLKEEIKKSIRNKE